MQRTRLKMKWTKRQNIYMQLKIYISSPRSQFPVKISNNKQKNKQKQNPNPTVFSWAQAIGEGRKDLLHLWIWASALHMMSTSPNRKLGLGRKDKKPSKHLHTHTANPEIPYNPAEGKSKPPNLWTTIPLVIASTGNKGRGEEIFFHRMNLNFHHVPKLFLERSRYKMK